MCARHARPRVTSDTSSCLDPLEDFIVIVLPMVCAGRFRNSLQSLLVLLPLLVLGLLLLLVPLPLSLLVLVYLCPLRVLGTVRVRA